MLKAITIYHLVHLLKNLLSLDDKGAMNRQLSRDGRQQCSMVNRGEMPRTEQYAGPNIGFLNLILSHLGYQIHFHSMNLQA